MYVCICSAFNEKTVKKAIDAGARSPGSVFRHLGCEVQCGKCVAVLKDMCREAACAACPSKAKLEHDTANQDLVYAVAAE